MKQEIRAGVVDLEPHFLPWVGTSHSRLLDKLRKDDLVNGSLVRWHVLGESHYARPDDPNAYLPHAGLTRETVSEWAFERSSGSAFFTRVASIISNTPPSEVDLPDVWQRFAYSNFVQELMDGPRIAPSASQWRDARRRFFGQLAITRPTVLVVLGSRQWEQLPAHVGARIPPFYFKKEWGEIDDAWLYPFWFDGKLECTVAVRVVHPSAGYGRWDWQVAAHRAQTAMIWYSNILEHFYDNFRGVGERPFWN